MKKGMSVVEIIVMIVLAMLAIFLGYLMLKSLLTPAMKPTPGSELLDSTAALVLFVPRDFVSRRKHRNF